MDSTYFIVRDYLQSLKEDEELDYIFPLLLRSMGFQVIKTAKEAKGQNQYGKDIIAVGKDESGVTYRFYFELKGHADKDITDANLSKKDGIIESLREAKYTDFSDKSLAHFNDLPIKIVLVHNGIIKENVRPTFDGFIKQEFKDGEFERWDIYKLIDLVQQHLFSEYLLTDNDSVRLFKRTLALLDAPDYDFIDFKKLVDNLLVNSYDVRSRSFSKRFISLQLISSIVLHYSIEVNNIRPAKECITYAILKTWGWILKNGYESRQAIKNGFISLLQLHHVTLDRYFKQSANVVVKEDGLFAENGGAFEAVGYPLRSFEYISYLVYYFYSRLYYPKFNGTVPLLKAKQLIPRQRHFLSTILVKNDATGRPLLDNHSIPILSVIRFMNDKQFLNRQEAKFTANYLKEIFYNIDVVRIERKRMPELYNNVNALVEFAATNVRPHEYTDSSTLLLTILFELAAMLNMEEEYKHYLNAFGSEISYQIAYPLEEGDLNYEESLFEQNKSENMFVDMSVKFETSLEDCKARINSTPTAEREFRSDEAGFPFLRLLARIYFQHDYLPEDWRIFASPNTAS